MRFAFAFCAFALALYALRPCILRSRLGGVLHVYWRITDEERWMAVFFYCGCTFLHVAQACAVEAHEGRTQEMRSAFCVGVREDGIEVTCVCVLCFASLRPCVLRSAFFWWFSTTILIL